MDDIVYKIIEIGDRLERVHVFSEDLKNDSIFYTNDGVCHQKIIVGRNRVFYIVLHGSLFTDKNDVLTKLTDKQLKLFYNISRNKQK